MRRVLESITVLARVHGIEARFAVGDAEFQRHGGVLWHRWIGILLWGRPHARVVRLSQQLIVTQVSDCSADVRLQLIVFCFI